MIIRLNAKSLTERLFLSKLMKLFVFILICHLILILIIARIQLSYLTSLCFLNSLFMQFLLLVMKFLNYFLKWC